MRGTMVPVVKTSDPTDVTTNSAKLNENVNPNSLQSHARFEWGTDNNLIIYTVTDNTAATSITLNSADLNGTVKSNGFETYAWF